MTRLLTAVVVHWKNEAEVARLVASWPKDPRLALLIVDNSQSLEASWPEELEILRPPANLGFGGAINHALASIESEWLLILNPDARPLHGALEALLDGACRYPEASGLVPALFHPDGRPQFRWQLQPLPSVPTLLLQCLFFAGARGPKTPPPEGTVIEQPAAAALMLRTAVLRQLGGFDNRFFPAWFEDVDLAQRLKAAGQKLVYLPEARFEHDQGSSVPALGYGNFLWLYDRHLCAYLRKHHGRLAVLLARLLLPVGAIMRLLLLPLRRPKRAPNQRAAAAGLWAVMLGAVCNFKKPQALARRFAADRIGE
jgi:GT2 family glycosyltransferase